MRKTILLIVSVYLLSSILVGVASASQENQVLQLGLVRNFGYGGLGKIQGNFTLKVVDPPDDLVEVRFFMDGELMEAVQEPPFRVKFHTSDYPEGEHQMSASGTLENGSLLASNTITKTFLSSDQAWSETQGIILPLLIGVGALSLMGIGVPLLLGRKKEFIPGKYGLAGGAVCPRCSLPFSRPYLAPNLLVGKLVRCTHCGKWSILPQASPQELNDAEKRYAGGEEAQSASAGGDDLKKMLEESRFED